MQKYKTIIVHGGSQTGKTEVLSFLKNRHGSRYNYIEVSTGGEFFSEQIDMCRGLDGERTLCLEVNSNRGAKSSNNAEVLNIFRRFERHSIMNWASLEDLIAQAEHISEYYEL